MSYNIQYLGNLCCIKIEWPCQYSYTDKLYKASLTSSFFCDLLFLYLYKLWFGAHVFARKCQVWIDVCHCKNGIWGKIQSSQHLLAQYPSNIRRRSWYIKYQGKVKQCMLRRSNFHFKVTCVWIKSIGLLSCTCRAVTTVP